MYIAIKQSFPSLVSPSITHSQRVKSSLGPANVEHNFQTKFACIFCHSSDKINYSHTKDGLCFGILQTSESAALRRNLDPRRESGNRKRKTTWSWITAFPGVISTQRGQSPALKALEPITLFLSARFRFIMGKQQHRTPQVQVKLWHRALAGTKQPSGQASTAQL